MLLPPEQRPQLLWHGDAAHGKRMVEGRFLFEGVEIGFDESQGWLTDGKTPDRWFDALRSMRWIADIMAFSNTRLSAGRTRNWIEQWLKEREETPEHEPLNVTGERLANLSSSVMFLLAGADTGFRRRLLEAMARDALLLLNAIRRDEPEIGLPALKGVVAAALSLPKAVFMLPLLRNAAPAIVARTLAADGSHTSRSPRLQAESLRDLVEIHAMLLRAQAVGMPAIDRAIIPAASSLRLLLHGDGGLSLFNDTVQGDTDHLKKLLTYAGTERLEYDSLKNGFYRLARGTAAVILDAGAPSMALPTTHLGTLSFELSIGHCRLVTNCGAYRGSAQAWEKVSRTTPAHSTLTLNRMDSYPRPPFSGYKTPRVEATYGERQHCPFVEARYTGYMDAFGLVHQRSLVLSESGDELRGIDVLYPAGDDANGHMHKAELRFHLHPSVKAIALDAASIELSLANGEHWLFWANWPVRVEESVYLGIDGLPQKTQQLYLMQDVPTAEIAIEWTFSRQTQTTRELF